MKVKFYIFCTILFFITYLFSIFLNFNNLSYVKQIKKFLKSKENTSSIKIIYNLTLLFLVIWLTVEFLYYRFVIHGNPFLIKKEAFIYHIGIAIFFFFLGLIFAKGKQFLKFFFTEHIYIIKTLSLLGIYLMIYYFLKYQIYSIFLSCCYFLTISEYLFYFKKKKEEMGNIEFLISFSFLIWISFSNTFLLMYEIINL